MEIEDDKKRLFFGAEVTAPWPETTPPGRIISEPSRHVTLAFLGNCSYAELKNKINGFPKPNFKIGPAGKCNQILFLPKDRPRVAAFHIEWLDEQDELQKFQKILLEWLEHQGYTVDKRELLSHVSIARSPFDQELWESAFAPIPIYIKAIHLYESVGNLRYLSRWEYPLISPFEEIEHTADIAFRIRGENFEGLYIHAMLALCFSTPAFLPYFVKKSALSSIEDVVAALNGNVAKMDEEIGTPFKAVSYHGEAKKDQNQILEWEMIVDV